MSYKVHTIQLTDNVLPLTDSTATFEIWDYGRNFRLKSILWTFDIFFAFGSPRIPIEQATNQKWQLSISRESTATDSIGQAFSNIIGPGVSTTTGRRFILYRPGQFRFDDFFCSETLYFNHYFVNGDAVNEITYASSVVVEIEKI